MKRLLAWREARPDLDERPGGFDETFGIFDFVEYLVQEQVGYMTPKTLFYATDFFATAFGFQAMGGTGEGRSVWPTRTRPPGSNRFPGHQGSWAR